MEKKEVHEYTFVNYPELRTREDYENAIIRIVDLHKDMQEVIALYRFGSISAPGISDIDYFIVTKGEDMNFRYKCPHDKLTKREKYLFQHYPSAVVPQKLLPQLHLLAPFFEIECIYQRDGYNLGVPSIKISKEEAQMFLADVIFMAYPKVFAEFINSSEIDVQKALKIIHSLAYLIYLSRILNIRKKRWEKYVVDGSALRKQWFQEKGKEVRERKILSLLNEGLSINLEIIGCIDQVFKKRNQLQQQKSYENKRRPSFMTRNLGVIFKERYNSRDEQEQMILTSFGKKMFISVLPITIAEHLKGYAITDTLLGYYVRKNLKYLIEENISLDAVKEERCLAVSKLLAYSLGIKYRQGAFTPFNLGYLNHQGIPNMIRDKIWVAFCMKIVKKQMMILQK